MMARSILPLTCNSKIAFSLFLYLSNSELIGCKATATLVWLWSVSILCVFAVFDLLCVYYSNKGLIKDLNATCIGNCFVKLC